MIKVKVEGKTYEVPNYFSEITMEQLDQLSLLLNQPKTNVENWCDVISYLTDIPTDSINNWSIDDFTVVVNYMFSKPDKPNKKNWFKIGKRKFVNNNDKLTTIESINIEKVLNKYKDLQLTRIFAVLFTEEGYTSAENYNEAAIAERTELFRTLKSSIAVPHLAKFGIKFVESYEKTIKEAQQL